MLSDILQGHYKHLSHDQIVAFIDKAIPTLSREYSELEGYLLNKQWVEAATQAHRFKGSISLIGCHDILPILETIMAKDIDTISSPLFQQTLNQQYLHCMTRIDNSRHKK